MDAMEHWIIFAISSLRKVHSRRDTNQSIWDVPSSDSLQPTYLSIVVRTTQHLR